jgi:hypothetical protein
VTPRSFGRSKPDALSGHRWIAPVILLAWFVALNLANMAVLTFLPPPAQPPPAPPPEEHEYTLQGGAATDGILVKAGESKEESLVATSAPDAHDEVAVDMPVRSLRICYKLLCHPLLVGSLRLQRKHLIAATVRSAMSEDLIQKLSLLFKVGLVV